MKIKLIIIFLISCAFLVADKQGIKGNWTLIQFINKESGNIIYQNEDKNHLTIDFKDDVSLKGNLTVNEFLGLYEILSDSTLEFKMGGITRVCCDDSWGERFIDDLKLVKKYQIKLDTLILTAQSDIMKLIKS